MAKVFTLPRDPQADLRTRRALDGVAFILNPLLRDQTLFPFGPDGRFGVIGLWFHGSGPPAETLAYQGDYYLDLTDGTLYYKT